MTPTQKLPDGAENLDPDVLAAIGAAVVAALGPNVRITRIRLAPYAPTTTWSEVGRSNLHSTHSFRKRAQ
ncbi:hypothetical protein GC173_16410 [bacterium]|nr:hypothetical protein [bacterium]